MVQIPCKLNLYSLLPLFVGMLSVDCTALPVSQSVDCLTAGSLIHVVRGTRRLAFAGIRSAHCLWAIFGCLWAIFSTDFSVRAILLGLESLLLWVCKALSGFQVCKKSISTLSAAVCFYSCIMMGNMARRWSPGAVIGIPQLDGALTWMWNVTTYVYSD